MAIQIPIPDSRALLPPILACLPIAFVSPQPPPALLPLLSPILRQRVQLLSTTSSSSDSWLPLLCWDSGLGKRLVEIVSESDAFELHPTSGEIELGMIPPTGYKRLDEETLQARVRASEFELEAIFLWCEIDGEEETGWKMSELKPLRHAADDDEATWHSSILEAEEKARKAASKSTPDGAIDRLRTTSGHQTIPSDGDGDEEDDDDYWALYDKTPGRTPGKSASPAPHPPSNTHARTASEAEYFERYAQVQPEMDNDDPSQDREALGESTLNGNVIASEHVAQEHVHHQLSNRTASSHAATSSAQGRSASQDEETTDSVTSIAVRQHVGANLKSLYKLCRATGMALTEFRDLVNTEMQALSMLDNDE